MADRCNATCPNNCPNWKSYNATLQMFEYEPKFNVTCKIVGTNITTTPESTFSTSTPNCPERIEIRSDGLAAIAQPDAMDTFIKSDESYGSRVQYENEAKSRKLWFSENNWKVKTKFKDNLSLFYIKYILGPLVYFFFDCRNLFFR